MLEIPLSRTHTLLLDEPDKPIFDVFRWQALATDKRRKKFYCATWVSRTPIYLHRLILNVPRGQEVDHINGNGLDCRRKNLRICTTSQNRRNVSGWSKRFENHTQEHPVYKGVYRCSRGRKYEARLCWEGKQRVIGSDFETPEEAARAHDDWARTFHGRFARLNFPLPGEIGVHDGYRNGARP